MGRKKTKDTEITGTEVESTEVESTEEVQASRHGRHGRQPLPETQELIDKIVAMVTEAGEEGVSNIAISQALEIGTLKASSLGTRLVRQGVLQLAKAENGRTSYFLAEATAEA